MSDFNPDDSFPGLDLSEFTPEEFAQIDAIIASEVRIEEAPGVSEASFQAEIHGLNLSSLSPQELAELDAAVSDADTVMLPNEVDNDNAEVSFRSDGFDLNLSSLTAEELESLENGKSGKGEEGNGGPSVSIEVEEAILSFTNSDVNGKDTAKTEIADRKSPLEEFRSYMTLSVTDLVSPTWCEVQYDYGLRGKRSRPIGKRPRSFVSAAGKTISPEITVVQKNDVQTKQGLAVHKELEREIKYEELQVEITTDETRWALRLVNMLACLKSMLAGFTREMPVFGILHGEVVVGIMDEVIKVEASSLSEHAPKTKSPKRPLEQSHSNKGVKRTRTNSPSLQTPQTRIESFFESPKKSAKTPEPPAKDVESTSPSEKRSGYILCIKDNKTRKNQYLPSESDMYSGRLQLMIYRRLLSELLARNPPYDFTPLWEKLGVDSAAIFPTKFLVQARLIQDDTEFQTACLDDLVALWHKVVKESNILGVGPNLELVYRLRPPEGKGKRKATAAYRHQTISDEEGDLARAIAASLKEPSARHKDGAGPSFTTANGDVTKTASAKTSIQCLDPLLDSGDLQLQWALQQSAMSSDLRSTSPLASTQPEFGDSKDIPEEDGIRRFKIIGTKKFLHDDEELDNHLSHVLKWWRGERKPEGVPIDRTYRCSTCEYANDCEWRAEKALDFSKKKGSTLPLPQR